MEIAIAIVGSSALSVIITQIFNLIASRKKSKTGEAAGVRVLLYDRIKHLGKKYTEAGYISVEDLEDLIQMHKVYHDDLNGNGFLDSIMTKVQKLPLKEEI